MLTISGSQVRMGARVKGGKVETLNSTFSSKQLQIFFMTYHIFLKRMMRFRAFWSITTHNW